MRYCGCLKSFSSTFMIPLNGNRNLFIVTNNNVKFRYLSCHGKFWMAVKVSSVDYEEIALHFLRLETMASKRIREVKSCNEQTIFVLPEAQVRGPASLNYTSDYWLKIRTLHRHFFFLENFSIHWNRNSTAKKYRSIAKKWAEYSMKLKALFFVFMLAFQR